MDSSNPVYSSVNGVLFNKTQTELLNFPGGKSGSYEIPAGVTNIANSAFAYDPKLTQVVIPKSVSSIEGSAFAACEALVSATFKGNAPIMVTGIFFRTASTFTVYYLNGSSGFTSPTWMGYPAVGVFATTAVSKVKACQIPGTHKVRIIYDLDSNSPTEISVQVWTEGATNHGAGVQVAAFSGNIGPNVASGSGKTIEFDAEKTTGLNEIFTKELRFKVIASVAPQQAVGNVSNLTLLDTENPAIRDLAEDAGDAATYDSLNEKNKIGVFQSEGDPLLDADLVNEYSFNLLYQDKDMTPWSASAFMPTSDSNMFSTNGHVLATDLGSSRQNLPMYQDLPTTLLDKTTAFPWEADRERLKWRASKAALGEFRGQIHDNTKPVRIYKRFEFPSELLEEEATDTGYELDRMKISKTAKKLIIVVHGWNPEPKTDPFTKDNWPPLLQTISEFITPNQSYPSGWDPSKWDLYAYRWGNDSYTGNIQGNGLPINLGKKIDPKFTHGSGGVGAAIENGIQAAEIGYQHGLVLGKLIFDHCQKNGISLEKVHFIAHSAGTWIARSASLYLKEEMERVNLTSGVLTQQITLLDPFNAQEGGEDWVADDSGDFPDNVDKSRLGVGLIEEWATRINPWRSENIFSEDTLTFGTNEIYTPFTSNRPVGHSTYGLGHAVVFGDLFKDWNGHSGPINFWAYSVNPSLYAQITDENRGKLDALSWKGDTLSHLLQVGWEHSLFYQEYEATNPSKLTGASFDVAANPPPKSSFQPSSSGPQYAPAPFSSFWQQILVDVDSIGWVRAMLLPANGGAAELAGPVRPEPDGTFSIDLSDGTVLAGAFDTLVTPVTIILTIDGVPFGQKVEKAQGTLSQAGVDAQINAAGNMVFSLVLADGTAGMAVAKDADKTGWEGAGVGMVDANGAFTVTGADGLQVTGQLQAGGGLDPQATTVVAPQVPEVHLTTADGSALVSGVASKDFGDTVIGVPSAAYVLTIRNTGAVPLTGLGLALNGSHPGDFTATGLTGNSLLPDESVVISITFRPQASGPRTAALQISSNDANENPFVIDLAGVGVVPSAPEIVVEEPAGINLVDGSATLVFGNANTGVAVAKTVTIRNAGTVNLTGLAATRSGSNASEFALGALGVTTLVPGDYTTFMVTFTPAAAGTRSAAIHIESNDSDENPFDISLSGMGVNLPDSGTGGGDSGGTGGSGDGTEIPVGSAQVVISDVTDQTVISGFATAALPYTVGPAAASITVSGSSSDQIVVSDAGISLGGSGVNRTITVKSAANESGTAIITLTVSDGTLTATDSFVLTVTPGKPQNFSVKFTPNGKPQKDGHSTMEFGSVKNANKAGVIRKVTITNTGTKPLIGLRIAKDGDSAPDFIIKALNRKPVLPRKSVTFDMVFRPKTVGGKQAFIHIFSSETPDNPFDFTLSGTGKNGGGKR